MGSTMTNSSSEKKKKRKLNGLQNKKPRPAKSPRVEQAESSRVEEGGSSRRDDIEERLQLGGPWTNLELIIFLQNKRIDIERRVEVAFSYVNLEAERGGNDVDENCETVKLSRLLMFLSDWVQSLLISTNVKIRGSEACLDCRCWVIFKFCLQKSLKLRVSLSLSRNLLRAIGCIAKNRLSLLRKESVSIGDEGEFFSVVLDSVSLVFSSHGGMSNENLDLWVSTVHTVLQLVCKVFEEKLEGGDLGAFALRLACLVLEPFAKFLRVHPTRKNGFRDFIDKLLEPLLHVLGVLSRQYNGNKPALAGNLLLVIEEVVSLRFFHPTHVDGFLTLHGIEKYSASDDGKMKDTEPVIESDHGHLFDKVKKMVSSKKASELSGLGELFRLLVESVKKQRGGSLLSEDTKIAGESGRLGQNGSVLPENSHGLSAEKRKSLFSFLVHIMEPLLLEIDSHIETRAEAGSLLLDVHCIVKSINNLLASILHGKLYVKTEDMTEGACLNFFKRIYNTIFSLAANVLCLPTSSIDVRMQGILTLLARENIVAFGYILDIENEVVDNNLTRLWFLMLSFLAFHHSFPGGPDQSSLTLEIRGLGCQLVKLYGELRQVNKALYALSKAIRLTLHGDGGDGELVSDSLWSSRIYIPYNGYEKSVRMLLCTEEFKLAIHTAIKSIPEGQVSDCIQQLRIDLLESLKWMKNSSSLASEEEFGESHGNSCELFGIGLSEMYSLLLDSLTVTVGNSILVGRSLKDLIAIIRPCMNVLVSQQSDSVCDFLDHVTGSNYGKGLSLDKKDIGRSKLAAHWVCVFFFHLYVSCRSLYRQALSLMPPDFSRKMLEEMAGPFTAQCGRDWMERTDWTDSGYFSWIVHPSASLPDIIDSVHKICCEGSIADCCPLIYILHVMALQRLADLNRQIKSLEYVKESNDNVVQMKLLDDTKMHQEASSLTEFIMCYLPSLGKDEVSIKESDDVSLACNLTLRGSDRISDACSVNERCWRIVCQNIDIWSIHASGKNLKIFLSRVIKSSLPYVSRSFTEVGKHLANQVDLPNTLSISQISSELLTDSILYEQKFVRRYLASSFCHLLDESIQPIFVKAFGGNVNLKEFPSWEEVLHDHSELLKGGKPDHLASDMTATNVFRELAVLDFTACQSLLGLLFWMPKGNMKSKSFTLYTTHLLNLERLTIHCLLLHQDPLFSSQQYELLRLLVSCRRALKSIIMAYCDEKSGSTRLSPVPIFSKDPFSILWLLKSVSVVVDLQETFPEESTAESRGLIVSLMDYTSYVFLGLSKNLCTCAFRSMIAEKPATEQSSSEADLQQGSNQSSLYFDLSKDTEAWKSVLLVAEALKEQAHGLLVGLKDSLSVEKIRDGIDVFNLNALSSTISCFSGFLWGLASAFDIVHAAGTDYKVKFLRWKYEPVRRINHCLNTFVEFIGFALRVFSIPDDHQLGKLCSTDNLRNLENNNIFLDFGKHSQKDVEVDISCREHHQKSENAPTCLALSDIVADSWVASLSNASLQLEDRNSVASVLSKIDSFEYQTLNKYLLQRLLKGDHPKSAILIRLLMTASSAILRLNLQNSTPLSSGLVPAFIGISEILLLKLADGDEVIQPFSFVWLDGVLKYVEELGSHLPSTNPALTGSLYSKLIELHIKALGKCISLQGKEATLLSHEKESSTKIFHGVSMSHCPFSLGDFKARLRMSFKALISKPSELHLLSSVQAIERALVGVDDGCTMIYDINLGSADGGKISSIVAAGIDCLDLILEYVSGRKRLNVVKRHIQSVVAALFNIILHLQSPSIFYGISTGHNAGISPDSGAAILMCVEVLTRVCGKHALFEMDSWHIAQSLRIPAALFKDFSQLRLYGCPALYNSLVSFDNQDCNPLNGTNLSSVDRQFSVELFAACCRLLYTIVKHHKSVTERCLALLQESTCVLLNSLENVDANHLIQKGHFSWGVKEGVKCASLLRRIYEELRQQKDVFGRHCCKFLCNYIWVYSGHGPLKIGIKREIDEALKPGVYALMDACSADDLQYLHSAFGEGPCRNTMANLQHDYKLNFLYEGKV